MLRGHTARPSRLRGLSRDRPGDITKREKRNYAAPDGVTKPGLAGSELTWPGGCVLSTAHKYLPRLRSRESPVKKLDPWSCRGTGQGHGGLPWLYTTRRNCPLAGDSSEWTRVAQLPQRRLEEEGGGEEEEHVDDDKYAATVQLFKKK